MSGDGFIARGQASAEAYIRAGVETWVEEDRISQKRAEELLLTLNAPEVQAAMLHLGAHFALSLPLRFPFGASGRFLYTLGLRLRGEVRALLHRGSAKGARRLHTFLVMFVALLPGFGRLAYFFSPALREERLLLFIPLDQASRKLPFRAYSRFHLDALFVYWGVGDGEGHPVHRPTWQAIRAFLGKVAGLRAHVLPVTVLLGLDALLLLYGAYLYLDAGRPDEPQWWWRERGLIATFDVAQLLLAAGFGIAAYLVFWKQKQYSHADAAGIFLWGIGALGLIVFALDDYFTVHERLGKFLIDEFDFIPVVTAVPSDMLVLGYAVGGLAMISLFRVELFSGRPSAFLFIVATVSCVVMVLTDGFGTTEIIKALEFPAQTVACSMLMLAFGARWMEVRQSAPSTTLELCEVGQ